MVFRYAEGTNPNGSINDIAGIINENGNVLGLMPHPENLIEAAHGGSDGRALFESALGILGRLTSFLEIPFPKRVRAADMRLTTARHLLSSLPRGFPLAACQSSPKSAAGPGGSGKSASLRAMEQVAICGAQMLDRQQGSGLQVLSDGQ